MAYEVDLNDKRLVEIQDKEKVALTENETTYNNAISGVDEKYNALIENSEKWAEEQKNLQNEQTDFAIEKIEQQREQTKKDYIKEQSGAYVDWQKEKDSYGASAEQMAAAGLAGAGYSESAQVSLYNTYQNRVATARDALARADLNYDNAINEAKLQNSSILAEIAFKSYQEQLELSLQGFQYKNSLIIEKANKKLEIQNMYSNQYMSMLNQIQQEDRLAEEIRQYNESLAAQKAYQNAQLALEREKFEYQKAQDAAAVVSAKGGSGGGSSGSTKGAKAAGKDSSSIRSSTSKSGYTGSSYSSATKYLKQHGVNDYNLMTESEWKRRKLSYKATGVGGYEVSANSSYAQYLQTSVAYAIKNN